MAASICDRSNPMASIFAIASARSAPMIKALLSVCLPPGVGVAGPANVEEVCAGAAGAAGVELAAGAGVTGGAAVEASAAGAGASLGCH